jgi:uncharacterized protein with LGFP repeats
MRKIARTALLFVSIAVFNSSVTLAQNDSSGNTSGSPPQNACGYELGGAIFAKWKALYAAGTLGCPVNSEGDATRSKLGSTGRWAQFGPGTVGLTNGYIIEITSGPRAGAVYGIHGCVFNVYSDLGSTGGAFGFPLSEEYPISGGVRADFEGGNVQYNAATGYCTAHLTPSSPPPI